eukprot:10660959-Heterocapsa_arctica.AAC.1
MGGSARLAVVVQARLAACYLPRACVLSYSLGVCVQDKGGLLKVELGPVGPLHRRSERGLVVDGRRELDSPYEVISGRLGGVADSKCGCLVLGRCGVQGQN